jgi:DNA polymerase delta subunit 1
MSWVTVGPGHYNIREGEDKVSTCQIEFDVWDYTHFKSVPLTENYSIAPFRTLSFDIEVQTNGMTFPTAQNNPIITIANIVKIHGSETPYIRNVFTLKKCAQIVGTHVQSFEDEADLLTAWRNFIVDVDADFLCGYNIQNFDFPYILERAEVLGLEDFAKISRIQDTVTEAKDFQMLTRIHGLRELKLLNIDGRVLVDML